MSNRQKAAAPKRPFGDFPFVLLMRVEAQGGGGGWVMIPMDNEPTDQLVRSFAHVVEPCTVERSVVIENTDEAFGRWAAQEGRSKKEFLR